MEFKLVHGGNSYDARIFLHLKQLDVFVPSSTSESERKSLSDRLCALSAFLQRKVDFQDEKTVYTFVISKEGKEFDDALYQLGVDSLLLFFERNRSEHNGMSG